MQPLGTKTSRNLLWQNNHATSLDKKKARKLLGPKNNHATSHCTAWYMHFISEKPDCTAMQCSALQYTALHCTALHCTLLYCSVKSNTLFEGKLWWNELHKILPPSYPAMRSNSIVCRPLQCTLHTTELYWFCVIASWTFLVASKGKTNGISGKILPLFRRFLPSVSQIQLLEFITY